MRDTAVARLLPSTRFRSCLPRTDGSQRRWLGLAFAGYLLAAAVTVMLALRGVSDAVGYLASALVLGSFASRSMIPLRVLALFSNVTFIAYAAQHHLPPVLALHAVLLPVNLVRIAQLVGLTRFARGASSPRATVNNHP